MKICSDCNVEMIEKLGIRADELNGIDNSFRLFITKNEDDYYVRRLERFEFVKCRICPKCGKVELYVNPDILNNLE